MKLLIGYDGSICADEAVADLELAGLPAQGEALVVTAGDVLFTPPLASHEIVERSVSERVIPTIELVQKYESDNLREARSLSGEVVARLTQMLPGWVVLPKTVPSSAARELPREALFWNADLIVVGSRGHSAFARFFLGSVSGDIASRALCSVRIGRRGLAGAERNRGRRIVIGVDASRDSSSALRTVAQRIWPSNTEVRLVAADEGKLRFPDVGAMWNVPAAEHRSALHLNARAMAEAGQVALTAHGLKVSVDIAEGNPGRVLIDLAREWKADCIFAGARGVNGGPGRAGLGSVATKLVANAPCSVELVRHKK